MQWTPGSDPPSQPMCARVFASFLRSHFHDNLCTVLDEYVRAEVSFAKLGFCEEATVLVEQGALSHKAVGECNGRSHTGSLGSPTLVGGKVDRPTERPLARLRSRSVGIAVRPLCPPLPLHKQTVRTMGCSDVLRGHAPNHRSVPVLPRESANIGDTEVHAGPSFDPHHHVGPGVLTHTTLTSTRATPCHLLRDPPFNMGQPMGTSPHTAVQPHPPIHTNLSPLRWDSVFSPRRETDRPAP